MDLIDFDIIACLVLVSHGDWTGQWRADHARRITAASAGVEQKLISAKILALVDAVFKHVVKVAVHFGLRVQHITQSVLAIEPAPDSAQNAKSLLAALRRNELRSLHACTTHVLADYEAQIKPCADVQLLLDKCQSD